MRPRDSRSVNGHKSQSALEYMMTYGWAILIIVIVAGVLYSLGIFNPTSSAASETVNGFSGLGSMSAFCYSNLTTSSYSQNVGLIMTFENSIGYAINITSINVTDSATSQFFSIQTKELVAAGGSTDLFDIPNVCPQSAGQKYSTLVKITYTEPGQTLGGTYVSTGTISGVTLSGASIVKSIGLIAFWPLNEGSGTVAHDASGNGNNGNIFSGAWISTTKFGNSLNFTGVTNITTSYVQTSASHYTVMAWMKIPSGSSGGMIIDDRGSGAGKSLSLGAGVSGLCLGSGAAQPLFEENSNGICIGVGTTSGPHYNNGNWYQLTGVFNSVSGGAVAPGQFSIFVNGSQVSTVTTTTGSDTSPLTGLGGTVIGYSPVFGIHFVGTLADVRVYNISLTSNEISEITIYNTII